MKSDLSQTRSIKSKRFRQKIFTEIEIAYCESKIRKYQHYAARFAAIEAVMKAISTGMGLALNKLKSIMM